MKKLASFLGEYKLWNIGIFCGMEAMTSAQLFKTYHKEPHLRQDSAWKNYPKTQNLHEFDAKKDEGICTGVNNLCTKLSAHF